MTMQRWFTIKKTFHKTNSRLSELGNTLEGIGGSSLDPDFVVAEIVSELTGDRAFKCYADLNRPLYEKVVCQIPVLIVDKESRPAKDQDLHGIRFQSKILKSSEAHWHLIHWKRYFCEVYTFIFPLSSNKMSKQKFNEISN